MSDALHDPDELLWQIAVSRPITIDIPENAVIIPGTGADIYDGMVISHWTAD